MKYTVIAYTRGLQRMARASQMARGALCRGPPAILEKNNYKRDELKSNFNNARWPLSYTAVF